MDESLRKVFVRELRQSQNLVFGANFSRRGNMNLKFPVDKQYSIVYADPPWSYRDKALAGDRGAECKYDCMSPSELMVLPVNRIVTDDAWLFLWCTMPMLPIGIELMNWWGFFYRTVAFTWVKRTKNGKLAWGMGNYTRANAELCLLGIRGRPRRVSAGVHSVIEAESVRHSQKPSETRERIVRLCGHVPRIELFARDRAPGWDAWGNEVGDD